MATPPTPTQAQQQAIETAKLLADSAAAGAANALAGIQAAIDSYTEIDNYAKSLFDYYSAIIRNYELEARYINGLLVANPVVEQDIVDLVAQTGRLYDGTLEADRIPEFDGLPLDPTDDEYEQNLFTLQDAVLDYLQNGLTNFNTSLNGAAVTSTSLTSSSTTLDISTPVTETINPGERLLIQTATDSCVVEVVTSTQGGSCSGEDNPPQVTEGACIADNGTWTPGDVELTIQVLIPPQATIPAGNAVGQNSFDGFDNTERTNKSPNNAWEQGLMQSLLDMLEDRLNRRKTVLQSELAAIQANDNDNIAPTAETDTQTSITAIDGFLGMSPTSSIDISDTGITAINSEKTTRSVQITARLAEITAEITAGDFYDLRYAQAAGRGQVANGYLAQVAGLQDTLQNAQDRQGAAQALSDRYATLLT